MLLLYVVVVVVVVVVVAIPRARVGYEMVDRANQLAIIISNPSSASGIIVLL